ncbi:MAG: serine/threonine-protein kinase [Planctomycetota bacterium]|nr:serine/threonine-protein kinase [Planctomycetota bacterium]
MDHSSRAEFERCALASGLLSEQQLAEAISAQRWSTGDEPDNQPGVYGESGGDKLSEAERLAERLVETGQLNPWQSKQLLEGQTRFHLGPYRIIDSLGQGGMGQVFHARHTVLGREVAVKVLPRKKSTPEAVAAFSREVRAQASLNHENLVQAYDAGYDAKVYYLVSEYVPGSDLRKLVRRLGPLDMQAAACIITQVARGLGHAHKNGLIHRDVKPANVLVTPDGRAKLSDLGLAGPLGGDAQSDPRFGKIVGTADYLSPDHIKAPWAPTAAWDLYSLGCTLYYAVTSKVPFPGGNTSDKARAHCQMRPLDPRRLNPTLSAEFVDVIADLMAKEPAERIPNARGVVTRLKPWVGAPVPIPAAAIELASNGADAASPASTTFVMPASAKRPPAVDPGTLADTADGFPQLACLSDKPSGATALKNAGEGNDGSSDIEADKRTEASQITHPIASEDDSTFTEFKIGDDDPFEIGDRSGDKHGLLRAAKRLLASDRFRNTLLVILAPLAILGIVLGIWNLISLLY